MKLVAPAQDLTQDQDIAKDKKFSQSGRDHVNVGTLPLLPNPM